MLGSTDSEGPSEGEVRLLSIGPMKVPTGLLASGPARGACNGERGLCAAMADDMSALLSLRGQERPTTKSSSLESAKLDS